MEDHARGFPGFFPILWEKEVDENFTQQVWDGQLYFYCKIPLERWNGDILPSAGTKWRDGIF